MSDDRWWLWLYPGLALGLVSTVLVAVGGAMALERRERGAAL